MAYSMTQAQLIRRLSMLYLDDWREGTLTSTTVTPTTTFVDTLRNEDDDFFNQTSPVSWIHILTTPTGVAPQGQEMDIADWVLSTTTGTLRAALTANMVVGSTYGIGHTFRWYQMVEALNEALDVASTKIKVVQTDESLSTVAAQFDYAVPAGFTHIFRICVEDSVGAGKYSYEVPPSHYGIVRGSSSSTPYIRFLQFTPTNYPEGHYYGGLWADQGITAGLKIRIEGLAQQVHLSTDSSVCTISPDFVCAWAAYRLLGSKGARQDLDPSNKAVKGNIYYTEALRLLDTMVPTTLPANTKRVDM